MTASRARDAVATAMVLWLGSASAEPIGALHWNDAKGQTVAVGRTVTVTGVVTAQFSSARTTRLYLQDPTGGVCVYGSPRNCAALGDSLRVTGRIASVGGLTQVTGGARTPLLIEALGRARCPAVALAQTATEVRATQQPGGLEPNEGRLVLVRDMLVRTAEGRVPAAGAKFAIDTSYRLAHAARDSATEWVVMRVAGTTACDGRRSLAGEPIPTTPVQVTGVLSQALFPATRGGYLILPRTRDDVQPGIGDYPEPRPNR